MKNFIASIKYRFFGNSKTTIGGGVFGVLLAAVFGKFEEMSGCKFSEVLPNIDWGQLFVFTITQVFGLFVTDSDKTIESKNNVDNK